MAAGRFAVFAYQYFLTFAQAFPVSPESGPILKEMLMLVCLEAAPVYDHFQDRKHQ